MRFAAAVGSKFERFAVIARAGTAEDAGDWEALPSEIESRPAAPLPEPSEHRPGAAYSRAIARDVACVDDLDAVWVSGVNPIGMMMAVPRRPAPPPHRPAYPPGLAALLPQPLAESRWAPLLLPLRLLDLAFAGIGRRARHHGGRGGDRRALRRTAANVLDMRVTQLDRAHLAAEPRGADAWGPPVRLLSVGRLAAEKNATRRGRGSRRAEQGSRPRFLLTWAGEGTSRRARCARRRAPRVLASAQLPRVRSVRGLASLDLYRDADAFVPRLSDRGSPGRPRSDGRRDCRSSPRTSAGCGTRSMMAAPACWCRRATLRRSSRP